MAMRTLHVPIETPPGGFFAQRKVWQWQIRTFHWVNAVLVLLLFLTGLYIWNPVLAPAGEAWGNFVMGTVRKLHFLFAFGFIINYVWRIYWFWMGNNYARSGFPLVWRARWWRDLWRQATDYLQLRPGHRHLGHNALGGLSYTLFVIMLAWGQIATGGALYSESNPDGAWGAIFGWVIPLLGGSFQVRMWHHLFAWGFIAFSILHVYIVIYDGHQYRNGLVSSMVSGYKFYEEGDIDHETWIS